MSDTEMQFLSIEETLKRNLHMSDIDLTAERYESVVTELGQEKHPYIMKMFDKEREDNVLEMKSTMYLYLAGNNKLLTDTRLGDGDCLALYHTLKNNIYISVLDLRYNNVTNEGAKHIAQLIQENVTLNEVNLMCNDIEAEGAEHLAKALHTNSTLAVLRLNGNKVGNKGGMHFAQALQVNMTLHALDLGDTDLKIESIIALATVLHQNKTLKSLNVNRPILFTHQEETTVHMAKMLKVNNTLAELHLQKYDMRDFGAARLTECLIENNSLTYLDLSCNRITRDGTLELAKILKAQTALKTLDLGYNRLEDDGAKHIADALPINSSLETLVIVSNNIASDGLCAIADSLRLNCTLTAIYIWGNKLEEPACIAFADLIKSNRIRQVNTDVKPFVVDGVTRLCEMSHQVRRHYYYAPSYGDDVPEWQPRGVHYQRTNIITVRAYEKWLFDEMMEIQKQYSQKQTSVT